MTELKVGDVVYCYQEGRFGWNPVQLVSEPMTITRETKTLWITDEDVEGRNTRRWRKRYKNIYLYDDSARDRRAAGIAASECRMLLHGDMQKFDLIKNMDKAVELRGILQQAIDLMKPSGGDK